MKKQRKIIVIAIIVLLVMCLAQKVYREQKVEFADEKMRQVICLELGKDKDAEKVMYKELDNIERLKIGAIGNFKTLEDLAKCKKLKNLSINVCLWSTDASYELYEEEQKSKIYTPASEEQIPKIEEDLVAIFKSNGNLETFVLGNNENSCDIKNLDFLKYGSKLKELFVEYLVVGDYSVIENCRNLEYLDLWYCNIETADPLLKLENLETIDLTGTPLSRNEEEMRKLKEAFPDTNIIIEN